MIGQFSNSSITLLNWYNNPSEFRFLGLTYSSPYVVKYNGDEGGQMTYYMLCWTNPRGETAPWSPTVSAIVQI
ncbi:MAG: hypothetical protein F6K35_48745 [Okeania sp. SIO2H7]|nr:hypothetical protein [Okeania sp. SIO2H7]